MTETVHVCAGCRQIIGPDEEVVAAAKLLDVTSQGDASRQYVEGQRSLFHERHYPGDAQQWREKARGKGQDIR
jgi:hypothetical protein